MEEKKFYLSKTFWVNVIALIVMVVQSYTKFVIPPEQQVAILGIVNLILRAVTGRPISFGKKVFAK